MDIGGSSCSRPGGLITPIVNFHDEPEQPHDRRDRVVHVGRPDLPTRSHNAHVNAQAQPDREGRTREYGDARLASDMDPRSEARTRLERADSPRRHEAEPSDSAHRDADAFGSGHTAESRRTGERPEVCTDVGIGGAHSTAKVSGERALPPKGAAIEPTLDLRTTTDLRKQPGEPNRRGPERALGVPSIAGNSIRCRKCL